VDKRSFDSLCGLEAQCLDDVPFRAVNWVPILVVKNVWPVQVGVVVVAATVVVRYIGIQGDRVRPATRRLCADGLVLEVLLVLLLCEAWQEPSASEKWVEVQSRTRFAFLGLEWAGTFTVPVDHPRVELTDPRSVYLDIAGLHSSVEELELGVVVIRHRSSLEESSPQLIAYAHD
jgi:hypothetical protein